MRFFFYGTLIDPEILDAVLRRPFDRIQRRAAVLEGYRCVYRRGACYPVLVPEAAARVEGTVVAPLTSRDVASLRLYEGPDYEIHEISVRLSAGVRTAFAPMRSYRDPDAKPHPKFGP